MIPPSASIPKKPPTEPPPSAADTYRVIRWCCLSGNCIDCKTRGNERGNLNLRRRVAQATGLSKEAAERYLIGWKSYSPIMEKEDPTVRGHGGAPGVGEL